ncbi:MAG: uridylate kinase [Planctomycetota bacterium]|jgi:uridylate kinase
MKFKRILLKLSGEALLGEKDFGIDPKQIEQYARDVKAIVDKGVEVAIVIGAGNIFRGIQAEETGIDRASGDYMGMLGTVMNGVALQSGFENIGINTRLVSAIEMKEIAESYIRRRAMRHLEKGRVVIFVAGTGSPYFTTDSAAALRASEINADVLIKGTRVDGIYTADPEKDTSATKFDQISFDQIIEKRLPVMDMTAFTMCQENKMPIIVFNMNEKGSLQKLIEGEKIGTLVD